MDCDVFEFWFWRGDEQLSYVYVLLIKLARGSYRCGVGMRTSLPALNFRDKLLRSHSRLEAQRNNIVAHSGIRGPLHVKVEFRYSSLLPSVSRLRIVFGNLATYDSPTPSETVLCLVGCSFGTFSTARAPIAQILSKMQP